ncbi:hypothetical protein [Acinetobacter venetianus]|uniref:hypothetical protein n=1 Tax=Acinetobacter venetianus TaxID=52133 RepID=UPI00215028C3|nr:hypothetical protein [Acinetobacter venetianus]MCR4532771.1 hypothetical protein [Acinetobacter venetianus]
MKKIILIIYFSSLLLTACEQKQNKEPEFKRPMGPYGLPYRVGNLGGKAVLLGEEVGWLEYEDSPVLVHEHRYKGYKAPPRDFNSVITSFGIQMKYTTGIALIIYRGAPQEAYQQYKAEINSPDNQWVSIGLNAGIRYHPDLTATFINSTLDNKIRSKEHMKNVKYINIYIPIGQQEFGLEKYAPHPEWVNSSGYLETQDMYIQKDSTGKIITLLECNNYIKKGLSTPRCKMRWNLEPFMKVQLEARFARVHLKDWQLIRKNSEKLIKSFAVDPKILQRIND